MDPEKLVKRWSKDITPEPPPPTEYITPGPIPEAPPEPEPDLFTPQKQTPNVPPRDAVCPPANREGLPDDLQAALDSIQEMKEVLQRSTGFAWLDYVTAAMEEWEVHKNRAPLLKLEARLREFARLLWRAERMLPTLRLNNHPKVLALEAGLVEGALVNPEARLAWKAMADLVWREFIQRTGPFAQEIIEETS